MGHFSMEIYAPNGSNLSGNQQAAITQSTSRAINPTTSRLKEIGTTPSIG